MVASVNSPIGCSRRAHKRQAVAKHDNGERVDVDRTGEERDNVRCDNVERVNMELEDNSRPPDAPRPQIQPPSRYRAAPLWCRSALGRR